MKRPRESDGARTPRKRFNGSSRIATCANKQQVRRVHSYTRAAEATTNHENDNEPRRTAFALIMKPTRESDGAPTPRKNQTSRGHHAGDPRIDAAVADDCWCLGAESDGEAIAGDGRCPTQGAAEC